jgi:copper homeostasis protein (lipoprotein)
MNRQSILIALALSFLALAGCKRDAAAPPPVEAAPAEGIKSAVISEVDHGSPASAAPAFDVKAFAGLYAGILPCADCPGIDTSIAFTPEGGYSISETYQDAGGGSFVTKGTWALREDGKTLLLDPEDKEERDRWFEIVSADELRALDRDGKPIDSTLDYSLRRK